MEASNNHVRIKAISSQADSKRKIIDDLLLSIHHVYILYVVSVFENLHVHALEIPGQVVCRLGLIASGRIMYTGNCK